MKVHTRRAYTILDVLRDFGGFLTALMTIFSIMMFPFSYFNYYINSIQMMFLAKTGDK